MAKRKENRGAMPDVPTQMNPHVSFDIPVGSAPKLGSTVTVSVTGKVVRSEESAMSYDDGKKRASLTLEYPGVKSVRLMSGKKSLADYEDEDAQV